MAWTAPAATMEDAEVEHALRIGPAGDVALGAAECTGAGVGAASQVSAEYDQAPRHGPAAAVALVGVETGDNSDHWAWNPLAEVADRLGDQPLAAAAGAEGVLRSGREQWDAMSEADQENIRGPMGAWKDKLRVQLANLEVVIEEHGGREAAARRTSAAPPKIIAARLRLAAVQQAGPSDLAAAAAGAAVASRATADLLGAYCQTEDADQARTARAFGFGTAKGRKSPPDKAAKHIRK